MKKHLFFKNYNRLIDNKQDATIVYEVRGAGKQTLNIPAPLLDSFRDVFNKCYNENMYHKDFKNIHVLEFRGMLYE